MDLMEINLAYCEGVHTGPIGMCGVKDAININYPILHSRVCDNYVDCPDGVDEFGSLGECEQTGSVGECCQNYILDGMDFVYAGDFNNRPYYQWDTNGSWGVNVTYLYIVYSPWFSSGPSYYMSPELPTSSLCYYDQVISNSSCPPKGPWLSV